MISFPKQRRIRCLLGLALVSVALLLSAPRWDPLHIKVDDCSICRLQKLDKRLFGCAWSVTNANVFSVWYNGEIEARHDHQWFPRAGTGYNVFGKPISFGNFGSRPFRKYSPTEEMEFFKANFSAEEVASLRHGLTNAPVAARFYPMLLTDGKLTEPEKRSVLEMQKELGAP